jgi:tRNA 2-thiouridine synthesizing protein C
VLVLVDKAPYGTSQAAEAFRYAIGLASMELEVAVALVADGVFNVAPGQDPSTLDMKPLSAAYAGLPSFGVKLWVCSDSLAERGLEQIVAGERIARAELGCLLTTFEAVSRF